MFKFYVTTLELVHGYTIIIIITVPRQIRWKQRANQTVFKLLSKRLEWKVFGFCKGCQCHYFLVVYSTRIQPGLFPSSVNYQDSHRIITSVSPSQSNFALDFRFLVAAMLSLSSITMVLHNYNSKSTREREVIVWKVVRSHFWREVKRFLEEKCSREMVGIPIFFILWRTDRQTDGRT